ncbi:radical SAM protein [Candidatus Fermentibacterales bacterium]|nr:radical SAM protein [Candidatus Fermentibacterales bacterium]
MSALRNAGHEPVYVDYSFCERLDELDSMVAGCGIVGVAISAAAKLERAALVSRHLRSVAPGACFVAGGAYPSIFPENSITETGSDYAMLGEAEEAIVELADTLGSGGDPATIRNLAWLDEQGGLVETPRRPVIRDLDSIPFPARDVVDYDSYLREGMAEYGMVTSRGCPFHCIYCKPSTDLIFGGGIRRRSAGNVVEEAAGLADLRGSDSIRVFFKDDTITMHPVGWFELFRDGLRDRGIRLEWHCNSRVDTVTEEKVRVMAESGCHCISFGVESGSQRILDFYRKGTTPGQAVRAFDWCHDYGIEATANLMIGLPIETEEDIEATYELLKRLRPDDIIVYFSTAIPGRHIHTWARDSGYLASEDNPELFDPARNRAHEVMNMRLPYLTTEDVISWKHRIERYRAWRKMTSIDNIQRWASELLQNPLGAARKAGRVLRGLGGGRAD